MAPTGTVVEVTFEVNWEVTTGGRGRMELMGCLFMNMYVLVVV